VDQDTQQLDGNNPQSDATPEVTNGVTPDAGSDTGQETPPEASAAKESAASAPPEPVSSMSDDERKAALEAIIYAADEPATIEQLASALGEPKAAVQVALDELVASYASDTRGIEIRGVAGGYKMYTKPQHHDLVRRFIKSLRPPLRLTMPALETLAVISYKQPVTAPEIQEIRGVNTSGVIKTLLDKKLITTAGRKEVIGRPILYRTSKEFLMRFGLSDLGELPSLKEFEALAREALGSDEGLAESDAGDESVLDSLEPTEAEAAAELEAAASEDADSAEPGDTATPKAEAVAARAEEASTPKQYEQSISADVAEAIAARPTETAATPQSETGSIDVVATSQHAAENVSESEPTPAEQQQAVHAAGPQPTAETANDFSEPASRPIVDAVANIHEADPSISVEPLYAEPEPARAESVSMEASGSPEPSTEYGSSTDEEGTEREISDEILAQLASGIEIEVSADSLAALSSTDVPAEEAPAQLYSSDAEPEAQPLSTPEATTTEAENATSPESEHPTEPEKSRKAAAGE
jgi:segregation and condensation protein B